MRDATSNASRLIVALDVPTVADALRCVTDLQGIVSFYKIGLELFTAATTDIIDLLKRQGYRIFLDLKMHDVDETIRRAVAAATQRGVDLLTIQGSRATVEAAVKGKHGRAGKLLFVPLLSSMGEEDLRELHLLGPGEGFQPRFGSVDEYALWKAREAMNHGCDGLIASGELVMKFREAFPSALIVSPAIRPPGSATQEHKRFLTPAEAIRAGADYLVVGRPIRDATNRREAAQAIIHDMDT